MIQRNNPFFRYGYKFLITIISFCIVTIPCLADSAAPIPAKQIKQLFTITGTQSNPLSLPSDVDVDDEGNIYIVDSGNHRIAVFNRHGKHISYISKQGNKQSEMNNPLGIDVSSNNIYVADKDNHRIQIFNIDGTYKNNILLRQGKEDIRPVDVAVNSKEKLIYISGNNNHKLMLYDFNGKLIRQWGGEGTNRGELRYPATISLYKNLAYIVDVLNSRVQIFDKKGELQAITGAWGVLPGQLFRPKGVALDQKGNIFISDSYLGVIQVFANDTRFRYVLADKTKPYKFKSPSGITIDKHNRLYVCEMLANKVSVFSLEP